MKRRASMICLTLVFISLFCGCTKSYELTTTQNDAIAQYAAGVLLKHTDYYNDKYEKPTETLPAQETTSSHENQTTEPESESQSQNDKGLSDLVKMLKISPLTINYKDYIVTDEYPNNASETTLVLNSVKGKKLLVVEMTITNPTQKDVTFSTNQTAPAINIAINDNKYYSSLMTLFLYDLSNIEKATLKAGQSYNTIVVFHVNDEDAKNINSITMSFDNKSLKSAIKIK